MDALPLPAARYASRSPQMGVPSMPVDDLLPPADCDLTGE